MPPDKRSGPPVTTPESRLDNLPAAQQAKSSLPKVAHDSDRRINRGRLTPEQRRMGRKIVALLTAEVGLTDQQLAVRLGVAGPELRRVVGWMIGTRQADFCTGYVVLPARVPTQKARAA